MALLNRTALTMDSYQQKVNGCSHLEQGSSCTGTAWGIEEDWEVRGNPKVKLSHLCYTLANNSDVEMRQITHGTLWK